MRNELGKLAWSGYRLLFEDYNDYPAYFTKFLGFSIDKSPNCMYCNRLYNIQQANRKAIAMPGCTTNQLVFSSLGRRKIQADFKGGQLTSDAGALSLREADKRLGLIDAINNCIPDPRHPREICGLWQRGLGGS